MALRTIPEGSVEIQTGLWAAVNSFTVGSTTYSFYDLYSSEGYCFWEINNPENYDEYGNLLPIEERLFYQYMSTGYRTIDDLNANFESVLVQDGYEIASVGTQVETETV